MITHEAELKFGGCTFFAETREVVDSTGMCVDLTGLEARILARLADSIDSTVPKDQLFRDLYQGCLWVPEPKILDVMVCKLRKKLNTFSKRVGDHIITVWGVGYQLSQKPVTMHKSLRARDNADHKLKERMTSVFLRRRHA